MIRIGIVIALGTIALNFAGCAGTEGDDPGGCEGAKCDDLGGSGAEPVVAPPPGQCVFARLAGSMDDVACDLTGTEVVADENIYAAAGGQAIQFTCLGTELGAAWFMSNIEGGNACAVEGPDLKVLEDFSAMQVINYFDINKQEWVAELVPSEVNDELGEYDGDWTASVSEWGNEVGLDITHNRDMSIRSRNGELSIRREMPFDLAGKRIGLRYRVLGDPTQEDRWWFGADLWFDIKIWSGEEQTGHLNYSTSGFGVFDDPTTGGYGLIPEDARGNVIELVIGRTNDGAVPEGTFELELSCLNIDEVGTDWPDCL